MKGSHIFVVTIILGLSILVFGKQTGGAETFAETGFEELMCRVETVAVLPDVYYSATGREKILRELSGELGIFGDYELDSFRGSSASYSRLVKNGRYGTTAMNWLALEGETGESLCVENYMRISLEIPGNIGSAVYYRERLKELLAARSWSGEVNLELLGILRGSLSEKTEKKLRKTLLKHFEEEAQLAFSYNEERDRTEVRLGLPFIRGDY